MVIVGVGVDIVEIRRIKDIMEKNEKFLEKIFTNKPFKLSASMFNKKGFYCFLSGRILF